MQEYDIIVVNEEPEQLELIKSCLNGTELKAEFINSASSALDSLKDRRPKVLVLAQNMQSMSGMDFMVEFSHYKHWDDMKILISSNYSLNQSDFFQLASLGANDVINLSSTKEDLVSKLEYLYKAG